MVELGEIWAEYRAQARKSPSKVDARIPGVKVELTGSINIIRVSRG
jgi:hypothetical protein